MIYQNPYKNTSPLEVRKLIREGKITGQTSGMCDGFAQANLCILPEKYAYDFLLFCQRNPQSCPLLEVETLETNFLILLLQNVTSLQTCQNTESGKKESLLASSQT